MTDLARLAPMHPLIRSMLIWSLFMLALGIWLWGLASIIGAIAVTCTDPAF